MAVAPKPRHRREGAQHFHWQRMTAISNLVLAVLLVGLVVWLAGEPYEVVRSALARPLVAIPLGILIIAGAWHMRLGMQVILEDYVHGGPLKLLLVLNRLFAIGIVAACVWAVVKLMTGAI